jgi:hypothetical protein
VTGMNPMYRSWSGRLLIGVGIAMASLSGGVPASTCKGQSATPAANQPVRQTGVDVRVDNDGHSDATPTARATPFRLYHRPDPAASQNALREALSALSLSFQAPTGACRKNDLP